MWLVCGRVGLLFSASLSSHPTPPPPHTSPCFSVSRPPWLIRKLPPLPRVWPLEREWSHTEYTHTHTYAHCLLQPAGECLCAAILFLLCLPPPLRYMLAMIFYVLCDGRLVLVVWVWCWRATPLRCPSMIGRIMESSAPTIMLGHSTLHITNTLHLRPVADLHI